jgi:transposase
MRGADAKQSSMLCLLSPELRVPADHPLRGIRKIADTVLADMSPLFDEMYAGIGRPSVPPERLLKGMLLMALYTVRSERQLCEQLDYNLLFRWFVGMSMVEESFDASTFSKNRERLMSHHVAGVFFHHVVERARAAQLMSAEHFTVDGTLIEAWASLKSFRPKEEAGEHRRERNRRKGRRNRQRDSRRRRSRGAAGGSNPAVSFHGTRRRNDTHRSTTDPEAKLYRKGNGKEARLCFSAHALMENRNGLLVDFRIAEASGRAERRVALAMLDENLPGERRLTLGADKGYNTHDFVVDCRDRNITPHVADKVKHSALALSYDWQGQLQHQSAHSKASRGDLRLDQDGRRPSQDTLPGRTQDPASRLHRRRCLQSGTHRQAGGSTNLGCNNGSFRSGQGRVRVRVRVRVRGRATKNGGCAPLFHHPARLSR